MVVGAKGVVGGAGVTVVVVMEVDKGLEARVVEGMVAAAEEVVERVLEAEGRAMAAVGKVSAEAGRATVAAEKEVGGVADLQEGAVRVEKWVEMKAVLKVVVGMEAALAAATTVGTLCLRT